MEKLTVKKLIEWIRNYVNNANAKGVILGMSGGKDSTVVAKLCAEALGKQNVYGLILPNGEMSDMSDAISACQVIGIHFSVIDINSVYNSIIKEVENNLPNKIISEVTAINTTPRLRMTTLYAFAGSLNYLVANTSNLSETMIGYSTKWGDNVGDFAPLANFTKTEVCEIGLMLGLPNDLVNKVPNDGLSGKSDEEKIGFSYRELDNLIRNGTEGENYEKIMKMQKMSAHKRNKIANFENGMKNYMEK